MYLKREDKLVFLNKALKLMNKPQTFFQNIFQLLKLVHIILYFESIFKPYTSENIFTKAIKKTAYKWLLVYKHKLINTIKEA